MKSTGRIRCIILMVVGLVVVTSSSAVLADDGADAQLQRALYFSDLYNWRAARPYFIKSQQMFEAAGDKRNALYARLGAIRAGAEPAPLLKLSYMLDQELAANPLEYSVRLLFVQYDLGFRETAGVECSKKGAVYE